MTRNQAWGLMVICLLAAWAALRFPNLHHTPPPIHYDEAANGVILREIAFAGYQPVFIPSYTGKDVLFFYLAGVVTRLGGSSVFTMRYTSALVSLLTIAATYWLGRELVRRRISGGRCGRDPWPSLSGTFYSAASVSGPSANPCSRR